MKAVGIKGKVGWHTFRRTYATLLKANGEDVKTVQELMRHANSLVTMNLYAQAVTDLGAVAGRGAPPIDRNRLFARVANEVANTLARYADGGFAAFAPEWQQRHAYQGKPVKLILPAGAAVKGTVAGVDASGALVLADGPRRSRFLSGEISLRRA